MNISVVVIAHNEEEWISQCLTSLTKQSVSLVEIIVVLHNCTDTTRSIVELFPVQIVECTEEGGPIIARARGIEAATGDIICCTDGDCWADKDWVKNISILLSSKNDISLVAGYTKIRNNFFWKCSCWWQFVVERKLRHKKDHAFAWGSNLAFRKKDYDTIGGLIPFLQIHTNLGITFWAEDVYLSLALQKVGKIFYATNAIIYTIMPTEKASMKAQVSIVKKQVEDNKKLFSFFT